MSAALFDASWQGRFKAVVLALLCVNTTVYLASGSPSEALDSVAWLTLLALFALESSGAARWSSAGALVAIRAARLAASGALVVALVGYAREGEWLDVANVTLWVGVVALLEFEVRRPQFAARHRTGCALVARALYGGLVAVALSWCWLGDWFDAYDAALWMIAFATLEMDVLGVSRTDGP